MPSFSKISLQRFNTCHPHLQRILEIAIAEIDYTILCGYRAKDEQDKAFAEGKSKHEWPNGKHNRLPSLAVDIVPYPLNWADRAAFKRLADVMFRISEKLGYKIRWGGDWDGDRNFEEVGEHDLPHFELVL